MNEALRVCFIAGTLGLGGAERQLYYMVKALLARNISCVVLCLMRDEPYQTRLQDLGVPVVWVGASNNRLGRLLQIITEVRKYKPDIVQSVHTYANIYAAVAGRACRIKSIGAIRSNAIYDFNGFSWLRQPSIIWPTGLIVNSKEAVAYLKQHYSAQKNIFFVDNVVDTIIFRPSSRSVRDETTLVTVGNLKQVKRHDVFLAVVERLLIQQGNIHAKIVGDGPLRDEISTQIVNRNLKEHVHLCGSTTEVQKYYSDADIFVHTSDLEGTPNVVLEAMACGIPVVATRAGGTSALVEHGVTGFLADCGDIDSLTYYVQQLVVDVELRKSIGEAARKRAVEAHSMEALEKKLTRVYELLLGETHC